MKLMIIVLNKVEMLEALLETMTARGLRGATILNSTGMLRVLTQSEDLPLFGSLRYLIDSDDREDSKTIFVVLREEQVNLAKQTVRDIVGDLSKPNTAILFTLPIEDVEGVER
ncbi:MAG: hypothetical protein GXY01_08245 [Clostridiales bacterium]|nr:hypothetical protein [Clostridiales bacterium]